MASIIHINICGIANIHFRRPSEVQEPKCDEKLFFAIMGSEGSQIGIGPQNLFEVASGAASKYPVQ